MATLKQRRGKWYARIQKWDGIRQHCKDIPLKTTSKVEARVRFGQVEKVEGDIKDGIEFDFAWLNKQGETIIKIKTTKDCIVDWLFIRKVTISNSHYRRNIISLNRFMDVVGKNKSIDSISTKDIEDFKIFYSEIHTPQGININLRAIKTFLKWCFEMTYINNMPKITMMRIDNTLPKYLTEDEFDKIMRIPEKIGYKHKGDFALPKHFKKAFWLYRSIGCRKSELFLGKIHGSWLIIDAKDTKSRTERHIKLGIEEIELIQELHRLRGDHLENKYKLQTFIDRFNQMFVQACKQIGIYEKGKTSLHCLRHTFAVIRYLETGDIYQVKMELGHTKVTTTEIYAKFLPEKLKEDFPTLVKVKELTEKLRKKAIKDTHIKDTDRISYLFSP